MFLLLHPDHVHVQMYEISLFSFSINKEARSPMIYISYLKCNGYKLDQKNTCVSANPTDPNF
jgi:hypothetical protein